MNIQEDQIIGELVAKDYRTASIFKKYGIYIAGAVALLLFARKK
jgi:hypothetical protein